MIDGGPESASGPCAPRKAHIWGNHLFKKIIAGAAIALAATFSVATAANADPYTPEGGVTVSDPTVAPGQSTTLTFADGSFAPVVPVTITISGEDAANATLASFRTAPMAVTRSSITKNSTSAGGLRVTVTLPAGTATGSYAIAGTDTLGNTVSTTISVVAAAGNGTATGGSTADGAAGLPVTGGQLPVVLIWTGGGLLLLGAALVAVFATVRRQRATA
ncbi:putative sortase sorted surface protein [Clavibacter sepedonicus]|uniref:Sortase sorted surface protein n=1 Tax=Clavibacter sepedonicus TaxID=31964 RepID=B0RIH8_CLASE|nr:putative sortase sorted surface protein [Clavibacter sepedonicus]